MGKLPFGAAGLLRKLRSPVFDYLKTAKEGGRLKMKFGSWVLKVNEIDIKLFESEKPQEKVSDQSKFPVVKVGLNAASNVAGTALVDEWKSFTARIWNRYSRGIDRDLTKKELGVSGSLTNLEQKIDRLKAVSQNVNKRLK